LMAEAIQAVENLYQKSILTRPELRPTSPDLLGLYNPPIPSRGSCGRCFCATASSSSMGPSTIIPTIPVTTDGSN
jgi:hypothetical protein